MNTIFGGLFSFETKQSLENFIEKIDKESAIKMIELSLLYTQKNGLYSFEESHIIYKCLNKLKENENNTISDNYINRDTTNKL